MRHIIDRVERANDFEVIIQLPFRRVLAKLNAIRIITLQQYRRLGWYASHQHDCFEPPINGLAAIRPRRRKRRSANLQTGAERSIFPPSPAPKQLLCAEHYDEVDHKDYRSPA